MIGNFLYLRWNTDNKSVTEQSLNFINNAESQVEVTNTTGPYKNNYATTILEKNCAYYWEIKIIKGSFYKIGIMKHSTLLEGFKGNSFSDSTDGFAYYSAGKLRNGSNTTGAEFSKGYGPGDIIKVVFNSKQGKLYFAKNDDELKEAFENNDFKKGGYVAAITSLYEGSKYSLTIPDLED